MNADRRLFIVIIASCAGCGASKAPMPVLDENLSDKECIAFAKDFEKAANAQDSAKAASLIDWETLASRAVAGVETTERVRNGIKTGFVSAAGKPDSPFMHDLMQAGKGVQFLRLRREEGKPRLQFRVIVEGSGIDYLDFLPFRTKAGQIKAYDIYRATSAELISETTRRLFLTMLPAIDGSKGKSDEVVRYAKTTSEITKAMQSGNGAEALRLFKQLPDSLQKDKAMLLVRVRAAATVDDERYTQALEAFQKLYPDDAAGDLVGLDLHILRKDADAFEASLRRLDRRIGGDPFLHELGAGSFLLMGKPDRALAEVEAGIKADRKTPEILWAKVRALAGLKRYSEAAAELKQLEATNGQQFDVGLPELAGFAASKEYKTLRGQR